nr:MAG TPA_asm: hypothetical protein [Caudoviricetes sp.]DAQ73320.1 MAG TPA: hypothetical protein [Caudoviricetes sp.]
MLAVLTHIRAILYFVRNFCHTAKLQFLFD